MFSALKVKVKKLSKYCWVKRIYNFLNSVEDFMSWVRNPLRREIIGEIKQSIPFEIHDKELNRIFLDLIVSRYKYKASIKDYFVFGFWKKSAYGKQKVVTEGQAIDLWQAFNPPQFDHLFRDKYTTYQIFRQFYGRQIIRPNSTADKSEIDEFLTRNGKFFLKPNDSCAGKGARIIDLQVYENGINEFLREINGNELILEELIEQDERISQLHPYSINTIRVNTVVSKSGVKIMTAILRLGNNRSITDNFDQGGIAAPIDHSRGIICGLPRDRLNRIFMYHPESGKKLIGFQIPCWQKVVELVYQLAEVLPYVRFVGWDIALTNNGIPIMVEGNVHPGFQVQSVVQGDLKAAYLNKISS